MREGRENCMIPNILTIAGSDCSGGAGLQADIKSISANGGYAMSVVTALTAQNTHGVMTVSHCDTDLVTAQIAAIRADIRINAIKIGMLGSAEIIGCVERGIAGLDCPVVLDPVMVAKGGNRLLQVAALRALRDLLPRASLITPNLPEAAELLDGPEATTPREMRAQAGALLQLGPRAVLLKGGHLPGGQSPDLLLTHDSETWFDAPRFATRNTHGTGCTLSSALATRLGSGVPLTEAARAAKAYVKAAIATADHLCVGTGHGPVNHFHGFQ